jgi:hypothetical protein
MHNRIESIWNMCAPFEDTFPLLLILPHMNCIKRKHDRDLCPYIYTSACFMSQTASVLVFLHLSKMDTSTYLQLMTFKTNAGCRASGRAFRNCTLKIAVYLFTVGHAGILQVLANYAQW